MRRLTELALFLAGLFAGIQGILMLFSQAPWVLQMFDDPEQRALAVTALATATVLSVALLGIGVVLVIRRRRIAARLFPETPLELVIEAPDLLRVGLVIVGLVVALSTLPDLIIGIGSLLGDTLQSQTMGLEPFIAAQQQLGSILRIVGYGLAFAVAIVLVFSSERVASYLWRDAKRSPEQSASEQVLCSTCGAPYDPSDYVDPRMGRCTACGAPLTDGDDT